MCKTLSKSLDISGAAVQVAQDLLKLLTILSVTTFKRSAIHQEDLKPYWKSEKRLYLLMSTTSLLIKSF